VKTLRLARQQALLGEAVTYNLLATDTRIDLAEIRRAVDNVLEDFLQEKSSTISDLPLTQSVRVLQDFVRAGGKRLRPILCLCGWYAAGGAERTDEVLRAAASLELFHVFGLIHDDIMDASDTRRGQPTVHRSLAATCGDLAVPATADRFGINSAILLGDLAFVWSDELLHGSGLTPHQLQAVRPLLNTMRTEVMLGQYLDLLAGRDQAHDLDLLLTMIRYKTAKYTVERPLHFGAALTGADDAVMNAFTAFALPIGEAFQLRDDLLGVFGDPAITGKSRLDDLRAGKATALLSCAIRRADAGQRATLHRLIGDAALDDSAAAVVRGILVGTGAVAEVEAMIQQRLYDGLSALAQAPFRAAASAALREIAYAATVRTA
jgi:geranylgeranyl diphosphate synthase type I